MSGPDALTPIEFRRRLLRWYDHHGRRDLPWQTRRSPYRVWVSEIMLQQTRVGTVIPYYRRFLQRFPSIKALAGAPLDEVLHHWTGLGYYARARNLHKAAQRIVDGHKGRFPREIDAVAGLPGIGRSTAGAILALACDQRQPILDGNVKRVLTRLHGIAEPPSRRTVETRLWELAERYTPARRAAAYTQAIMDLGATVCLPRAPLCEQCPVATGCAARRSGEPERYPGKEARKTLPERHTTMVIIHDRQQHAVLLQKRPPSGIWGGLWSFPEHERGNNEDLPGWCRRNYGLEIEIDGARPAFRHTFSHFHLDITAVTARAVGTSPRVMEAADTLWYNLDRTEKRGLAAPVKRLLDELRTDL
jgi:A/G-specific adenine glycosylase